MSITKKLFYINSSNRISGTDSDFYYQIDLSNYEPTHVLVLQANIPKSYYVVQNGYNTFTLSEPYASGTSTTTITIPAGNYNRSNFMIVLQSQLTTLSAQGYTYTISIPNSVNSGDTGKYTFSVAGNGTYQPSFIIPNDPNNMYEMLGFVAGSTNTFVTNTLTSTNVIKLLKEDSIFIHSDIVGGVTDDVLQEIYTVDNSDFSNIVFQNFARDYYDKEIKGSKSNSFRFYLMNEGNEAINLNGLNWTMTLCVFKKDNTNEMLKQYMKYQIGNS